MKKSLFTLCFLLAGFSMLMGQANSSGSMNINVGVGVSPTYFSDIATLESTPLHFSVDYSIFNFLSAGVGWSLAGASEASSIQGIAASLASSYNTFSLRANGHLPLFERVDLYAGGSVGVQRIVQVYKELPGGQELPDGLATTKLSEFQPEVHVGVRLRILGNLGFYAEGGYGLSLVQAGLNMKL